MTAPALGIDIAKLKFNACLINTGGKLRHKVFANNSTGFEDLRDWLSKQGVERSRVCMEATGTYGEALALSLYEAGHTVSVVNPAAVKAFAQSRLSRTKTDRVDAELIARFCVAQEPSAWTPPAAEIRELQALVRRHGSAHRDARNGREPALARALRSSRCARVSKSIWRISIKSSSAHRS